MTPYSLSFAGPGSSVNIEQSRFNDPELCVFQNLVAAEIPGRWQQLGIQLDLGFEQLIDIQSAGQDNMGRFALVFIAWKNQTKDFSWEAILSALRTPSVNEQKLASDVSDSLATYESRSVVNIANM